MIISILVLLAGLLLVIFGADALVDGASGLARKFGVSEFVIGLTIVGFGTSCPELVVSLKGAIMGASEVALGNVLGSNIFNTLLILGLTAVMYPIAISPDNRRRDIPITVAVTLLFLLLGYMGNSVSRIDGLLMIVCFGFYLWSCFKFDKGAVRETKADYGADAGTGAAGDVDAAGFSVAGEAAVAGAADVDVGVSVAGEAADAVGVSVAGEAGMVGSSDGGSSVGWPLWKAIIYVCCGLAALIFGGNLFVDSAVDIAHGLGVSEKIIAVTLLAGGTSFPELVTCIVAGAKHKEELALGNILGSNVFNILLIIGCSSLVRPLSFASINMVDAIVLLASILIVWFAAFAGNKTKIDRWEGGVMLAAFICYYVFLFRTMS